MYDQIRVLFLRRFSKEMLFIGVLLIAMPETIKKGMRDFDLIVLHIDIKGRKRGLDSIGTAMDFVSKYGGSIVISKKFK